MTSPQNDYKTYPWRISYRTSALPSSDRPVNILHDFYIPVLRRSVSYDRVAGYFRSSSLAAASQGFSAFFANKGHARFIVGADLAAQDVAEILNADEGWQTPCLTLEKALNAELYGDEIWPENIRDGVRLLGHLIREGILEIRVAFRVHAETGKPLHPDAVEDGYVHMKWGVLTDAHGSRIYVSGSLNESRTALTLNAENIDVHCDWKGESERIRADEAEQEFELLWNQQIPALRVLTLPDAVRHRMIRIADGIRRPTEIDGSSASPLKVPPPSPKERLSFALIKHGPMLPGGRFVGMETAPVMPWPHQDIVARRLISTWPFSYLLCDEVGLGKTIEAGLAIRSLHLSGIIRRVLIAPPASLTEQWQREMAGKFLLPFARALGGPHSRHAFLMPHKIRHSSASLYAPDLNIVSTGLLVRPERQKELRAAENFDLVLVDEAHYARQSHSSQGYRNAPRFNRLYRILSDPLRPKARCVLLATATPMQLHPAEVFDLIRLTKRVGAFQDNPGLIHCYYEVLSRLVYEQSLSPDEWAFLRNAIADVEKHDPDYYQYLGQTVIDGRIRACARRWLEHRHPPHGRNIRGMQRLIFSAAPLSRVMLRHTRPLLEMYREKGQLRANLAERVILPLPRITFTRQEQACYDQLERYCKRLTAQIGSRDDKKQQTSLGFYLSFLRLRFASSLFAIRQTLKRRRERVLSTLEFLSKKTDAGFDELEMADILEAGDDDADVIGSLLRHRKRDDLRWEADCLSSMLNTLSDLSLTSSKMSALLGLLQSRRIAGEGRIRQTVIFTRFYDTLMDILERLRRIDPHMRIGTFSGQGGQLVCLRTWKLTRTQREDVKRSFLNGETDILVCTDAAAEGLNLQTADLLVNFDLPWNPMKVEQRIGRIDRIAQTHERIYVHNLCYAGSAEEIVYGRLLSRLSRAGDIVGTQQISLLPVTPEDFRRLAEGELSESELEENARKAVRLASERSESREISPEDLCEIYSRLRRAAKRIQTPVTLDIIWKVLSGSQYLRDIGCTVSRDGTQKLMTLRNIPGIPDGTLLTASRKTFEYGPGRDSGTVHFASYGDPMFDAVLDHISDFHLPGSVRLLEVRDKGTAAHGHKDGCPLRGYAVACLSPDGQRETRLLTGFADLRHLEIDESGDISEAEMALLQEKLTRLAEREFRQIRGADFTESLNVRAAKSQTALNYMIIRSLLQLGQKFGMGETCFWAEVRRIEDICQAEEFIQIADLEKGQIQKLRGLLFELQIPVTGNHAMINAPVFLVMAALDTVCQLAHQMRRKKADLLTADVLNRIDRELSRLMHRCSEK